MNEIDITKTLGVGGAGAVIAAMIYALVKIASGVFKQHLEAFKAVVAELKGVRNQIGALDAREAERHAHLREEFVKLDAKVSSALDWRDRSDRFERADQTPVSVRREPTDAGRR